MPKRSLPPAPAGATPIDWTLLRSFVAVVDTGSLTAAARRLGTTQPTVGRHIRALEGHLGETLFERRPEGLLPNARATAIYESAAGLDEALTGLTAAMNSPIAGFAGTVRITTSQIFAVEVLPPILAVLLAQYPGLEVELIADDELRNLFRREADIAVRFVRPEQPSIVATKVADLPVGLYASREWLAARGGVLTPAMLAQADLVGPEDAAYAVQSVRALGLDIDPRHLRFRSASWLAQRAALRAGVGVGACQCWLAEQDANLVRVLPQAALHPLSLWVAAHDDFHRSRRIRAVFDFLAQALRERFRNDGEVPVKP